MKRTVNLSLKYENKKNSSSLGILLIGYSGKRNVGAEIRAVEIIKNIKKMNLATKVRFGVLSLNPEESRHYYSDDVEMIHLSPIFFKDLLTACSKYDIGILSEGSCLTSVTSNIAPILFICAAGILKAQNKICVAYGVEAGPMPKELVQLAKRYADNVHFVARTSDSLGIAKSYNLQTHLGTDTAWSVNIESLEWAKEALKRKGIDTSRPLIGISPINAFIRPIYPSIAKYIYSKLTNNWEHCYQKFYYYTYDRIREALYEKYMSSLVKSINVLVKNEGAIPILIEMEPMDSSCVRDLARRLPEKSYIISSSDYKGTEIIALLNSLNFIITSRYHAHVLSMLAGVPCVALSKDQRLTTIFKEHQMENYCVSTHDPLIEDKLPMAVLDCWKNKDTIKEKLKEEVIKHRKEQNNMDEYVKSLLQQEMVGSNGD